MRDISIKQLKQIDNKLTIGELIVLIENKEKEEIKIKKNKDDLVINTYLGKCIKIIDEDGLFGKTIEIYKIDDIKFSTYDTSYNVLYGIDGVKLTFADRDINKRKLKSSDCRDSFRYDKLQKSKIITIEEYNQYLLVYENITDILTKLINE